MKFFHAALAFAALMPAVLAHHGDHGDEDEQHTDEAGSGTLAPSPTESIGCEAHGDHWHCDGPVAVTTTPPPSISEIVSSIVSDLTTITSSPSISISISTDDHDDDDHTSTDSHDDDHDDEHTDESGTGTLAPSPTESVGCEAHGDHWHCDGPRGTTISTTIGSVTTTEGSTSSTPNAAPQATAAIMAPVAALLGMAAIAL